jgi:hypothetical protein
LARSFNGGSDDIDIYLHGDLGGFVLVAGMNFELYQDVRAERDKLMYFIFGLCTSDVNPILNCKTVFEAQELGKKTGQEVESSLAAKKATIKKQEKQIGDLKNQLTILICWKKEYEKIKELEEK